MFEYFIIQNSSFDIRHLPTGVFEKIASHVFAALLHRQVRKPRSLLLPPVTAGFGGCGEYGKLYVSERALNPAAPARQFGASGGPVAPVSDAYVVAEDGKLRRAGKRLVCKILRVYFGLAGRFVWKRVVPPCRFVVGEVRIEEPRCSKTAVPDGRPRFIERTGANHGDVSSSDPLVQTQGRRPPVGILVVEIEVCPVSTENEDDERKKSASGFSLSAGTLIVTGSSATNAPPETARYR